MSKSLCNTWKTLEMLCAAVAADKNKRINLNERFQAYDKLSTGFVSMETFLLVMTRELHRLITMKCADAKELADYFKIADGRIDYKRLCSVIDNSVVKLKGKPLPVQDAMRINMLPECEEKRVALLLACIAKKLSTNKVLPGLNIAMGQGIKSTISNSEFGKVLNFLGICLTPVEYHLLSKKFARDPFYVSYSGFLHSVFQLIAEFQQAEKDSEKCPEFTYSRRDIYQPPSAGFSSTKALPSAEQYETCCGKATELECVMDRIRLRIKFRGLDLRTQFRDWDKLNNGHISKTHYWRVFRDAGFFFTAEEMSILENCYYTEHGMDYLAFLQDLTLNGAVKTQVCSGKTIKEGSACGPFRKEGLGICCGKYTEPNTTIFKLEKRKIARDAFIKLSKCPPLNLSEIFKDQDKVNSGWITKEQLLRALGRRNVDYLLSAKELRELCDEIKHKNGSVNYRILENALNIAKP